MNAKELITQEDLDYCIALRRQLHRRPEVGFDLPETAALVKGELEKLGLTVQTQYAPCSAVAILNPDHPGKTVLLRADMDALPILEKSGLDFSSEKPGMMHACGHDAHTAMLLTVGRVLSRVKEQLPVRVMLLFQPSEECETSGAKSMVDHGAADDVDFVVMTHCSNDLPSGTIGYRIGPLNAACDPVTIVFKGKTAHATLPEQGIDAIAMAWQAYADLKQIAAEEAGTQTRYIFGMNYFHGGTAHNVVSDRCELKI